MRNLLFLLVLCLLTSSFHRARAASQNGDKQVGLGLGIASPTPIGVYALTAMLEGTMRFSPFLGVSILASATSSAQIGGTYFFGSNGGYQQTFVEPRFYLNVFHFGFALGLELSPDGSGTIQGAVSYGPMIGFEIPIKRFSVGVDARYIAKSGSNPSPLSLLTVFRFQL